MREKSKFKELELFFVQLLIGAFPLKHCMRFVSNDLKVLEYYNHALRMWKREFATQKNLGTSQVNRLKAGLIV